MTTEQRTSNYMERYAVALQGSTGGIRGVATPYGIPNGRPGVAWQIGSDGFPEMVRYEGTVWEPGVFSEWLAAGNARRVRFLFQHGDAGEAWSGSPFGANALPIGTINALIETDTGLEFDASFAGNELANAVKELVSTGALEEVSIAFGVYEFEMRLGDDGKMYRHATGAELYDVSVVVWGQYGLNATVTELYNGAPHTRDAINGLAEPLPNAAPVGDSETMILNGNADAQSITRVNPEDGDEERPDADKETGSTLTDVQRLYMAELAHRELEI